MLQLLYLTRWIHRVYFHHLSTLNSVTDNQPVGCNVYQSDVQGSHASWKVLDFFLKIQGPGKSWKSTLFLEIEA